MIVDMVIWLWYGVLVKGQLYEVGEFLQVNEYFQVICWVDEIVKCLVV